MSMPSTLVDMKCEVFAAIQLPANFGQYSSQELTGLYEQAIIDLPRPLVDEVSTGKFSQVNPPMVSPLPARPAIPNTSQGAGGGARICAVLHDRLVYLRSLVEEVRQILELLHQALGGFDTDAHDPCQAVGLNLSDPSKPLNPLAAYLLRALIRMRMADVDFELVSKDVEKVLEAIVQVQRGLVAPAVSLTPAGMVELETQYRAWESVYLDIRFEWFEFSSGLSERTIFFRDQQRRQQFRQWQSR